MGRGERPCSWAIFKAATICELLECVYPWQMGNLSKMQNGPNNIGFQTYPVKYQYFKASWRSSPSKERNPCMVRAIHAWECVHPPYYWLNAKANLHQIWLEVSVWVESVSSTRNTECRKQFWIPDMQDLFLLICRGHHCLKQKKIFFSPRFGGTHCMPETVSQ